MVYYMCMYITDQYENEKLVELETINCIGDQHHLTAGSQIYSTYVQ